MLLAELKICGISLIALPVVLTLLADVRSTAAQDARFFRISGPAATKIMALRSDGSLVWSNAVAGTVYTVQTLATLPGGTSWVDYVQLPVTNRVNTNQIISFNSPAGMVLIPAGSFTMGDTLNDDGYIDIFPETPAHTVMVSAFYMDRFDVTLALWQQVYNWATNHGYHFDYVGTGKAANHPVLGMNWYDCLKWCNARSEMAGLTPAYYTNAAQTTVFRTGNDVIGHNVITNGCVKWNAGYRLPTEAEWEKAARGGLSGQRFPWGSTISWGQANYYAYPPSIGGYAYDASPANGYDPTFYNGVYPYTSPVGYFAPNGYGLYDMAGNVEQWCWDVFGSYGSAAQSDPRNSLTQSSYIVVRGGYFWGADKWKYGSYFCRLAARYGCRPDDTPDGFTGFRCVLSPSQ